MTRFTCLGAFAPYEPHALFAPRYLGILFTRFQMSYNILLKTILTKLKRAVFKI